MLPALGAERKKAAGLAPFWPLEGRKCLQKCFQSFVWRNPDICGANVSEGEAAASLAAAGTLGLGEVRKAKPCSAASAPSGPALSTAKVEPLQRPGNCLVLCESPDHPKIDFYFQLFTNKIKLNERFVGDSYSL